MLAEQARATLQSGRGSVTSLCLGGRTWWHGEIYDRIHVTCGGGVKALQHWPQECRPVSAWLVDVFICTDIVGRSLRSRDSVIVLWNLAQSLTSINSRTPELEGEVCSRRIDKLRV